jgi:hypothetical protein
MQTDWRSHIHSAMVLALDIAILFGAMLLLRDLAEVLSWVIG